MGKRGEEAAAPVSKWRQVTFNAGNITITPPSIAPPPKKPSSLHQPPLTTPFLAFFPANQPPPPTSPPLFTSFADLFKSHQPTMPSLTIPLSQRGILPLPSDGWKNVSYKKYRKPSYPSSAKSNPTPFPKHKRCFFYGDIAHMASSCSLGDFKCFACNRVGHTSVCCSNKKNPPLCSITPHLKSFLLCSTLRSLFHPQFQRTWRSFHAFVSSISKWATPHLKSSSKIWNYTSKSTDGYMTSESLRLHRFSSNSLTKRRWTFHAPKSSSTWAISKVLSPHGPRS